MTTPRRGRQTPTQSVILPYTQTRGGEAVELYNSTGRTAQEWQELMLYDILAVNDDGLWVHTKFGYSVSRRNGKNEIIVMVELFGLKNGEHILHTAHRTTTTHAAWERLYDLCELAGLKIISSYRAYGKEHIEVEGGGKVEFRTRTSKGGLGEGFDRLIIDEAQEYQDDQESALKYVVSDSKNPQTILTGTPPTPVSSGTVFVKFRGQVLSGAAINSGWAEWSVERQTDPHDIDAWYETNPSLGIVLTERKIADEIGNDDVDFNIQRLGLWIRYNQKSAISREEWESLKAPAVPGLTGKLFVGIKFNRDGESVSMAVAVRTDDGRIFVEAIDCQSVRNGSGWILDFLRAVNPSVKKIIIDGANRQSLLEAEIKECRIRAPVLPTVQQVIVANAAFEEALYARSLCHMAQPSVVQAVSNCERRAIGSNGGFGFKAIRDGVDISLLDSIILAHWAASDSRTAAPKQKFTC